MVKTFTWEVKLIRLNSPVHHINNSVAFREKLIIIFFLCYKIVEFVPSL